MFPARVCPGSQLPAPSPPSPGHPRDSRGADLAAQLLRNGGLPALPPAEALLAGPVTPRRGPRACPRSVVSADPAPWGPACLPAQGGGRWPGFCCCLTQARCGGWGRGAGFLGGSQFSDCLHPSAGPLHQPLRRPTGRHRGTDSVQAWLRPCWPGHLGHMASWPRLPHRSPTSHPLWGWGARQRWKGDEAEGVGSAPAGVRLPLATWSGVPSSPPERPEWPSQEVPGRARLSQDTGLLGATRPDGARPTPSASGACSGAGVGPVRLL